MKVAKNQLTLALVVYTLKINKKTVFKIVFEKTKAKLTLAISISIRPVSILSKYQFPFKKNKDLV